MARSLPSLVSRDISSPTRPVRTGSLEVLVHLVKILWDQFMQNIYVTVISKACMDHNS